MPRGSSNNRRSFCTCSSCSSNALLLETFALRLKRCKEISFTQDTEDPDNTQVAISTQAASKSEGPTQLNFELKFSVRQDLDDNGVLLFGGKGDLQSCSRNFLQQDLVACVANNVTEYLQTIKVVAFDHHLCDFIEALLAIFVERNKPLKRLVWDSCNFLFYKTHFDGRRRTDVGELTKVCKLCEEFHFEYSYLQGDLNGA